MTNNNSHSECLKCVPYFYDFVFGQIETIPNEVVKHISNCPNCGNELENLKNEIKTCENTSDQAFEAASLSNLQLHFAHIGKSINCSQAKFFLIPMSSESFKLRIPTPVTVHFHHCTACAEDLMFAKGINLPEKELLKLGRVFAELDCSDSKELQIFKNALDDFNITDLQKKRLAEIAARQNSDVATIFSLKDDTKSSEQNSESIYDDWQVDVKKPQSNSGDEDNGKKREKGNNGILSSNLFSFAKPFIAAAAVFIVVFLFLNGSKATAGLSKVYKALENVKNIHIKSVNAADDSVTQEIWVSKTINVKIFKSANKTVLWDLENKQMISHINENGIIGKTALDKDSIILAKNTMKVPWSLLPFKSMPAEAKWKKVTDDLNKTFKDVEVYELTWEDKGITNSTTSKKWRGYLIIDTYLPKRIEWLEKYENAEDYQIKTIVEVAYPQTEEIKSIINSLRKSKVH